MLVDLRPLQRLAGPDPKCGKLVGGRLFLREPKTIESIVLHQTAVRFGARAADVNAERGDKQRGRWRRALGVHAHVTVFTDGAFCPAYPLTSLVWHGNGANTRSVGLEVEGLYNGRPGGKDDEPDELTIATALGAIAWIRDELPSIRFIDAHRQWSDSRRADPGWALWRRVALACGLETRPALTDTTRGVGRPIPEVWDPSQVGVAY